MEIEYDFMYFIANALVEYSGCAYDLNAPEPLDVRGGLLEPF
jgi:hypothetical protein